MKYTLFAAAIGLAASIGAGSANAAPITMTGNFLLTQISDDGTLGNGTASPGLIHDPSGTGTFDAATGDYLRPGIPFEGFGVRSDQTGLVGNRNSSGGGSVGGTDGVSQVSIANLGAGTMNHVRWVGLVAGQFNIRARFHIR